MAPRPPQVQDLMRLIPPELQSASFEEKMNYLKGLVTRNATPGGAVGTPNANSGSAPSSNPVTAAVVHRLCTQAGITIQQFQSMNQQQQQSFMATQAAILRQQTNRAQGRSGGGTPNPQGQTTTPGQGQGPRPSVPGGQQQQTQGSPAISALQPPPNINGMTSQQSSQMPGGPLQNQAQAAAALAAAAAGNNPALQARLMQMRAQGQAIPQGLQSQLAAVAAAQNAGQGGNIQGGAQGTNGMMGQQQQTQGGGSQNGPTMNNQSPRTLPTTIPPTQQGSGQTTVPLGSNPPGTPGAANGQNPGGVSSQIEQQRAFQEIQNILANLPEFLKMKDENRLSDQQMKMLDYIVKMKGPGTYAQFLRTQQAATQRNEQLQAQRQLNQQNQQQRQQGLGTPGQPQENLALHAHQQQALFRQLQNMQQQQMSQASGNMDQQQLPGMHLQNNSATTPRPPALGLNGQGVATPNSQGTSSPVTMNTPVSMGTPSGSASGSATAAMAFKKIEDMSDEKRNIFFRNVSPRSTLSFYQELLTESADNLQMR
ncbi:hypothetical protein QFC19_006467 [Naganishia cerealis]|uniref:Uncharacterized protein n=1 Tax=Naganishia cerealis TaxID=610337 RepID=A0ACC2VH03_9TREE|nr:hypothetical protein QFC19_006467 [Naganishia cerealis]